MRKYRSTIVGDTIEERAVWLFRGGMDTLDIARKLSITEADAERLVHGGRYSGPTPPVGPKPGET